MRLNWFSTWILFLTPSYLEQSFSGEVKVISTHDEKGLLYSLCLYTNLPLTLPHSDVTVTKVYTNVCSYFCSAEFYYRNLGNFSIFPPTNYSKRLWDSLWAPNVWQKSQTYNTNVVSVSEAKRDFKDAYQWKRLFYAMWRLRVSS